MIASSESAIPKPHLSWLNCRRSEFGSRHPHLHLHHTQAHLQPCLGHPAPERIQHLPSRKVTVHHRAGWFVFFFSRLELTSSTGFECWRSKLRKTELHLTKIQEVKNKQTKPWYARQAQKLEVFAGSAYCHTSRPGRQAFFHFAGKPPQSTVSGNICH